MKCLKRILCSCILFLNIVSLVGCTMPTLPDDFMLGFKNKTVDDYSVEELSEIYANIPCVWSTEEKEQLYSYFNNWIISKEDSDLDILVDYMTMIDLEGLSKINSYYKKYKGIFSSEYEQCYIKPFCEVAYALQNSDFKQGYIENIYNEFFSLDFIDVEFSKEDIEVLVDSYLNKYMGALVNILDDRGITEDRRNQLITTYINAQDDVITQAELDTWRESSNSSTDYSLVFLDAIIDADYFKLSQAFMNILSIYSQGLSQDFTINEFLDSSYDYAQQIAVLEDREVKLSREELQEHIESIVQTMQDAKFNNNVDN